MTNTKQDDLDARYDAFLRGLEALSREHGLWYDDTEGRVEAVNPEDAKSLSYRLDDDTLLVLDAKA